MSAVAAGPATCDSSFLWGKGVWVWALGRWWDGGPAVSRAVASASPRPVLSGLGSVGTRKWQAWDQPPAATRCTGHMLVQSLALPAQEPILMGPAGPAARSSRGPGPGRTRPEPQALWAGVMMGQGLIPCPTTSAPEALLSSKHPASPTSCGPRPCLPPSSSRRLWPTSHLCPHHLCSTRGDMAPVPTEVVRVNVAPDLPHRVSPMVSPVPSCARLGRACVRTARLP